jgi:hypothetical protein
VARTFEKYLRQCAKEDSFTLMRCLESHASGEDGKRGSCNQGWGLGTCFPSRHHEIWIGETTRASGRQGQCCARSRGSFLCEWWMGPDAEGFLERITVAFACPHCQSKTTHRSKRRGTSESTVLRVIPMRPFRCEDCDRRFYAFVWPTGTMQSHSETSGSIVVRTRTLVPNDHRSSCTP